MASEPTESERMQAEAAVDLDALSAQYLCAFDELTPHGFEYIDFPTDTLRVLIAEIRRLRAVASPLGEAERAVIVAAIAYRMANLGEGSVIPAFRAVDQTVDTLLALRASAPEPPEPEP